MAITTSSMKKVIDSKKEEFIDAPINEWLDRLKDQRLVVHVEDVESVEKFLHDFKERYKE